jgi:hypothetical protein
MYPAQRSSQWDVPFSKTGRFAPVRACHSEGMPRLSKKEYWKWHKSLRWLWLNHQDAYSYLSPSRQWLLHDFFLPSKDLTKEELLEHRKAITKERPGLPHQAGWALRELNQVVHAPATVKQPVETGKAKRGTATIRVRSLVKPEIDYDKVAKIFFKLAERQNKHKQ